MNYRIWITGIAAILALSAVSAAVVVTRETPSPARAAAASASVSVTDTAVYLVRDYGGELCVFREGDLIERTGIPVSTLPRSDRALAEVGITVTGRTALAELLGDLGS